MDRKRQLELQAMSGRGGQKQRRERLEELAVLERVQAVGQAQSSGLFDSELATELLTRWAWGSLPAADVQRLAAKAYTDQLSLIMFLKKVDEDEADQFIPSLLKALKELGSSGAHPGNCSRDLLQYLAEPEFPKPTYAPIHIKIVKQRFGRRGMSKTLRLVSLPFFLPHTVLSHMFSFNRSKFNQVMFGDHDCNGEDKLEAFWNEVESRDDPRLAGHPMRRRPDWKQKAIPIAIHGDGVGAIAVGKAGTKSIDVLSFQSILGRGAHTLVKLWMFALWSLCQAKRTDSDYDTMDEVWTVILWSFIQAYLGKHPGQDWNHKEWADGSAEAMLGALAADLMGGFFCVIWSLKGGPGFLRQGLQAEALWCRFTMRPLPHQRKPEAESQELANVLHSRLPLDSEPIYSPPVARCQSRYAPDISYLFLLVTTEPGARRAAYRLAWSGAVLPRIITLDAYLRYSTANASG